MTSYLHDKLGDSFLEVVLPQRPESGPECLERVADRAALVELQRRQVSREQVLLQLLLLLLQSQYNNNQ